MTKESVESLVDEIEEELNEINESGKFQYYSDFIQRYSDIYLHRNHYLIMTAARLVFSTALSIYRIQVLKYIIGSPI